MATPVLFPGGSDASDSDLVQRTLAGDSRGFEALVRRHERLVFRIAGGFLRDRAEVEDVAQEAFMRAFAALARFRPGAEFGPWIAQIATRVCYDRLRTRQRQPQVGWEDLPPGEQEAVQALRGADAGADRVAARDLANRLLESLAPRDRQAIMLVDALGYSGPEAAKIMRCSAVAVRLRLHRARRAMREAAERLMAGQGGERR
ncbi:MAG TPA: RNA polymerase sigma factor [Candidatus Sulfotelmatobacter sp.]|nr:RNA polymerase sigma factor [Candidatus Sulfotelmatobacter sp.]